MENILNLKRMNCRQSRIKRVVYVIVLFGFFTILCCRSQSTLPMNINNGWESLFDGSTTEGWKGYNCKKFPENWKNSDGELTADGTGGDLVFAKEFTDFEVEFEWKVEKGGNSGFFFHVNEGEEFQEIWRTGIEMQLMDDAHNPLGNNLMTSSGSVYELYPAKGNFANPHGVWNTAKIEFQNGKVRYSINGQLVNEFEMWSPDWYAQREQTIHNSTRKPRYGEFKSGYFALQDEGFPVAFRKIRVKPL